jgi:hypothetical protein
MFNLYVKPRPIPDPSDDIDSSTNEPGVYLNDS